MTSGIVGWKIIYVISAIDLNITLKEAIIHSGIELSLVHNSRLNRKLRTFISILQESYAGQNIQSDTFDLQLRAMFDSKCIL